MIYPGKGSLLMNTLLGKIKKSKEKKWSILFRTKHPEGDRFRGVVTEIKRSFIVLREEYELDFDGIIIAPKKYLKGCRDTKHEAISNRILRYTGAIKKAKSPKWLNNCDNLPDVILQIKKRDIWPIIEIIFDFEGETISDFYLGRIVEIKNEGFMMQPYDSTGNWDELYYIEYKEIFKIQFEDQYSTIFNDYMRNK